MAAFARTAAAAAVLLTASAKSVSVRNDQPRLDVYGNIMDADLAAETTALASAQIGQEAATAVMVQANTISKEIVSYLLQGMTN